MIFGEAPEPSPAQVDIRVAVHAVGLNPVDYKIARMGHPDWRFPYILGLDVAGVVDAIGSSVSQWQLGDWVFYHGDLSKPGGFAEFAVTTTHTVARIPDGMSFVDAASLPCAGLTAYHALHRRLHVRAGQSFLVHVGAGGVGGLAIQLAAHAGLKVLTTCSANNFLLTHLAQPGRRVYKTRTIDAGEGDGRWLGTRFSIRRGSAKPSSRVSSAARSSAGRPWPSGSGPTASSVRAAAADGIA